MFVVELNVFSYVYQFAFPVVVKCDSESGGDNVPLSIRSSTAPSLVNRP